MDHLPPALTSMSSNFIVLPVVAIVTFAFLRSRGKHTGALPPGPKPLPIIGNAFDLVAKELWVKASGWAKTYGSSLS